MNALASSADITVRPLLVAEMFGPTFQGEGPSAGQQAAFVRLSRCNLSCPPCDTPETWDTSRFDLREYTTHRTVAEVAAWLLAQPAQLVVITGGEPLLQQDRLVPLVEAITAAGRRVEVETNGTIVPAPELVAAGTTFNVSPKLSRFAGAKDQQRRFNPDALAALLASGRAVFKFVAGDLSDLDEVAQVQAAHGLDPVWVMPEGTSSREVLDRAQALADAVLDRGWHLSSRVHILLWGDVRGR
ncbi:7-carboxy-7-deazaguanine synthase QueE [Dactylosporangium siamense]|uniref:7-carboxy-7-deazaguanine synthase n=1 Tax=Dactylosporangium siamense TaxID=685454 RepID=A0A919UEW0_9ACTN|nr:7-carboxy-7-deazaguanine synthase QueE [Dactylosporangium siamense]GIG52869.1 radical SAM protein [Dactylosporangium siamense]